MNDIQTTVAGFPAQLIRRPVKNLRLTVKAGGLIITAPQRMPLSAVEGFVRAKSGWLEKHLSKQSAMSALFYRDGDILRVWGRECPLTVTYGAGRGFKATADGAEMRVREGADREEKERVFLEFCRGEVARAAADRMRHWESVTGLKCAALTVRGMKSRWGSCKTGEGRIALSLHLAKFPPECLDYIIVHELAHILIPNHGDGFKALMDRYYPDWHRVRKLLK